MTFFDIIKILYKKDKVDIKEASQFNITLTKWLSYDPNNLFFLKKIVSKEYHIRLDSNHYFILLFLGIKKGKVPYLGKIEKKINKNDKLCEKIRYYLKCSKRELETNKGLLDTVINKQHWRKELAVG